MASDPDIFYFPFGAQDLLFDNHASVFMVFFCWKILQLFCSLMPQKWAFFRYGNKQLRRQNTLGILAVSLIEVSVNQGTVFCFGQISNFYGLRWSDKTSLIFCAISLFLLFSYSICYYLLSRRYCA